MCSDMVGVGYCNTAEIRKRIECDITYNKMANGGGNINKHRHKVCVGG